MRYLVLMSTSCSVRKPDGMLSHNYSYKNTIPAVDLQDGRRICDAIRHTRTEAVNNEGTEIRRDAEVCVEVRYGPTSVKIAVDDLDRVYHLLGQTLAEVNKEKGLRPSTQARILPARKDED